MDEKDGVKVTNKDTVWNKLFGVEKKGWMERFYDALFRVINCYWKTFKAFNTIIDIFYGSLLIVMCVTTCNIVY